MLKYLKDMESKDGKSILKVMSFITMKENFTII